ncbi:MAG: PilW family protein [Candidatus Saccharimonadales bacterium]
MSANTNKESGTTLVELLIATAIIGLLIVPTVVVMVYFYGGTVKNSTSAKLAVESQNVLRLMVEELRVSSGVRDTNTIFDANGPSGGWTTSVANLVLIVSTPVMDNNNNYVMNPATGAPYQNETVYFASNGTLYKRYLANASAPGNRFKTSCPEASATATCPPDVVLSNHFKDMTFIFYDQDNIQTSTLAAARSIQMAIQMEQKAYGHTITFDNNIRITLRNTL